MINRGKSPRREISALDRDRTGDLFLTKEVLCQLSYKGAKTRIHHSRLSPPHQSQTANRGMIPSGKNWSGKRDLNPRPPAWKAGALPLSYSRKTHEQSCNGTIDAPFRSGHYSYFSIAPSFECARECSRIFAGQKFWGGEDSNLRSLAATDLQSVPFVHSGTSPSPPFTIYHLQEPPPET